MNSTSLKAVAASSLSKTPIPSEYPLERVCRHQYEPFQLNFARHALALFPQEERSALEATHQGLVLRVQTETELEKVADVLRDYFGDQITFWHPARRHHEDEPIGNARAGEQPRHERAGSFQG